MPSSTRSGMATPRAMRNAGMWSRSPGGMRKNSCTWLKRGRPLSVSDRCLGEGEREAPVERNGTPEPEGRLRPQECATSLAEAVGSVPRPRGLPPQMLSLGYAARPLGGPCVEFGGPAGLSCAFTQMRLDGEISGQTVIEAAQFGETGRRADGLAEGHG